MKKFEDNFDKIFGRMQALMFIWLIFVGALALGVFGFIIYIAVKVLRHFAIL
jgi:hypothetical protein